MTIAIASGKGGTGKTTVATNLASIIAEEMPVNLIDLDVEEPNSGLFLDLKKESEDIAYMPKPTWNADLCTHCGKCEKLCQFNAIIEMAGEIILFPHLCKSCYACSDLCPVGALPMSPSRIGIMRHYSEGNLHFTDGLLDIGQESATPIISKTIEYAGKKSPKSEITLYDAPPGASCPAIEATKDVDMVLLVTEPTPFGLNDLKIAVATMKKLGKEVAVVINKHGIGYDEVEKWCESENIEIAAKLPNSKTAAINYSDGKLLYKHIPEIKNELLKLKDYIFEKLGGKD